LRVIDRETDSTASGWNQKAPREAPFAASPFQLGISATGAFASYTVADTWYPSWGSDGQLYSPFTDGEVHGLRSWSVGETATTGHAIISGSNPLDLKVHSAGVIAASPGPYGGRYPSASLMLDGTWYYGTYCLADRGRGLNWDRLGPFVGFRVSTDNGVTWDEGPHTPDRPIFEESGFGDGLIRMGAPHFVDFGQNMVNSPDGYAYLVGHGSQYSNAQLSWISGDEIYLARVLPTLETINDPRAWQFFGGFTDDQSARWVDHVSGAQPIASWKGHMGCSTVTYVPATGKYIMCVTDGWPTIKEMDSYILESDSLTGPWRMVAFMEQFGKQAYFLNFPSKFISADGSRAWLCYSANFTSDTIHPPIEVDPAGSRYAMCLMEVEFVRNTTAAIQDGAAIDERRA
jgi:hypothetical protein